LLSQSKGTDLPDAIEWVSKNAGQGKYEHVDKTRIAAAGQSCGGIQAYSASLDPRVTLTAIFNSGLINEGNTKLFEKLHAPVGFFLGGPTDIAYENVSFYADCCWGCEC
jgi:dienelactone hydrolase